MSPADVGPMSLRLTKAERELIQAALRSDNPGGGPNEFPRDANVDWEAVARELGDMVPDDAFTQSVVANSLPGSEAIQDRQAAPCPFCGKIGLTSVEGDDAARWVQCRGCGAHGPTVSRVGSLSVHDQVNRAREKFYRVSHELSRLRDAWLRRGMA